MTKLYMKNKQQQKLNDKILKAANRKQIRNTSTTKYLKSNGNVYLKAKRRNLTKIYIEQSADNNLKCIKLEKSCK